MKLYLKYISIQLRCQMQYKVSFFMLILGSFLASFTGFLETYFLLNRFHSVEGFTMSEVLLCFGIVSIGFAIAEGFVRGFDLFPSMIGNGEFDRILLRPRNEVFQVLAGKVEFARLGRLSQAIIVFIYAVTTCNVTWTGRKRQADKFSLS